jgi:hypothetical protein
MTASLPSSAGPRLRRARLRLAGAATLLALLAVTACSSNNTSGSNSAADSAPDGGKSVPMAAGGDALNSQADQSKTTPITAEQRSIIFTGTITVKVDDVVAAADRATATATGLGGYVAGDNRTLTDGGAQATLELKVPANTFESTLDGLAKLGTEEGRQVNAQDVTETMIDLDARIATQQASLDRVRQLLAQAKSIGDIVSLENELTSRQADLDSLTQRRNAMSGMVALATITVVLYGPTGPAPESKPKSGFMAGLRGGWDGFLTSVAAVLTVAGWLLPWIIALGVPAWVIMWLVRRRRRATTATIAATASPGSADSTE